MSTMYSRSFAMLQQAKNALKLVAEDDAYLDVACFETQQALEFLMKTILMENGVAYGKSHDIRYLLDLMDDVGFSFEKRDANVLSFNQIKPRESQLLAFLGFY